MEPLQRLRRTFRGLRLFGGGGSSSPEEIPRPVELADEEDDVDPRDDPAGGLLDDEGDDLPEDGPGLGGPRGISAWVERRAQSVVSKIYETRADDLEGRARRAVGSAYRDQADDLEERAIRAMRHAITAEADRIKEVIEHAVNVKKREVRLSLLVLVTASLVYLALYWFTSRPSA
jgi:hypothetical protein